MNLQGARMVFCRKCSSELPTGASFCPKCGAAVTIAERIIEEYRVSGGDLVNKVKELIHEGNVRRIVIKHGDRTLLEIPLTIAAVGIVLAPVLAAIGTLAALATDCTILIERVPE
jgi:uncharacterized membrane protein YvbJ